MAWFIVPSGPEQDPNESPYFREQFRSEEAARQSAEVDWSLNKGDYKPLEADDTRGAILEWDRVVGDNTSA